MTGLRILMTGCSGGGKSTTLKAMADRGVRTVPEPGLRVVRAEQEAGGSALPWVDMEAFAKRALQMAITDIGTVRGTTAPTYFDRGTVDAASALEHVTGQALTDTLRGVPPYSQTVILFPPWPELFVSGADRPHGFEDAFAENERIRNALTRLEYDVFELPKTSVEERVDIILGATGRT